VRIDLLIQMALQTQRMHTGAQIVYDRACTSAVTSFTNIRSLHLERAFAAIPKLARDVRPMYMGLLQILFSQDMSVVTNSTV